MNSQGKTTIDILKGCEDNKAQRTTTIHRDGKQQQQYLEMVNNNNNTWRW